MQTLSEIIGRLGGTSAVANAMRLTPSTVSSWKTKGRLPLWRHKDLIRAAKRAGVVLTYEELQAALDRTVPGVIIPRKVA